jgi:hypothetical protein
VVSATDPPGRQFGFVDRFSRGLLTKILCKYFVSPLKATFPNHRNLVLNIEIILVEFKLQSYLLYNSII